MSEFDVTARAKPKGFRGKIGRVLERVVPDLDQRAYSRARRAELRARQRSGLNARVKRKYPQRFSRKKTYVQEIDPHVVVVPAEGCLFDSWRPAGGNFYFEVAENLASHIGSDNVSVLHVRPGTPPMQWQADLFDHLMDVNATHLISHIEHDPGGISQGWTWDSLWHDLASKWRGVFLGSTFDASFRFISAKAKILANTSPRFMAIDVGLPIAGTLKKNRFEVGPVNRPMSPKTLALIDQRLGNVEPSHDVVFIGAMYPYRVNLVEELKAQGISVEINPHRGGVLHGSTSHGGGEPSWLDYLAGLRSGRTTINFSRSSAGPIQQLKWRVVEAGLSGTHLVTDDVDRTSLFWPREEFSAFASAEDLAQHLPGVLSDSHRLQASTKAFAKRARWLAQYHYWGAIEFGLNVRGLPGVGVTPFAAESDTRTTLELN